MIDFGGGLDSVARVITSAVNNNGQAQLDTTGAVIYLSPRTYKSLFAELYLMNDPFHEYPTIQLAHAEPAPIVANLNQQGANIQDFLYYQGVQGPIKIWKVSYPSNIVVNKQFLDTEGTYAEFDNLTFST